MTLLELGRTIFNYIKILKDEKCDVTDTCLQQYYEEGLKYLQEAQDIFRLEPKGTPESTLTTKIYDLIFNSEDHQRYFG